MHTFTCVRLFLYKAPSPPHLIIPFHELSIICLLGKQGQPRLQIMISWAFSSSEGGGVVSGSGYRTPGKILMQISTCTTSPHLFYIKQILSRDWAGICRLSRHSRRFLIYHSFLPQDSIISSLSSSQTLIAFSQSTI